MRTNPGTKRVPNLELSAAERYQLHELLRRIRLDIEQKYPTFTASTPQVVKEQVQEILKGLSASERELLFKHFPRRMETPNSLPLAGEAENQHIKQSLRETCSFAQTPPAGATFLLLLAPKRYREHLLGDLEEEYREIVVPRYGHRKAKLWYWWQVIVSLAPIVWDQAKRFATLRFLWKLIH